MIRGYKRSYLEINIILILVIVMLSVNLYSFQYSGYLICTLCALIPFLIMFLRYGFERKKRRYMYELIFYVFSYCIVFLLLTYFLGLFIGFTRSIYKLNLNNLIHNIIPYIFLIFASEFLRYEVSRKGEGSPTSYVLVVIIFILIDMTLFLNTYSLNNGDEQIKYICSIMLPSVFKNIVLMYFTRIGGLFPSLIYRIILDLKLVILPIFPNFGLYFDCTINCILPVIICLLIENNLSKTRNQEIVSTNYKNSFLKKYLILIVLLVLSLSANILASGKFKYNVISIGSGSMTPKIRKGDAVLYEKINHKLPEVGQVLVFKKEKKIVVHRIIEIVELPNNEKIYYTKGDANEAPDGYPIERKDMIGVVKFRIRYIGMPSVALGELIKNN